MSIDDSEGEVIQFAPGPEMTIRRGRTTMCQHRRMILDEDRRMVQCKDCDVYLDPYNVLYLWASRRMRFRHTLEALRAQRRDLVETVEGLRREERNVRARLRRLRSKEESNG